MLLPVTVQQYKHSSQMSKIIDYGDPFEAIDFTKISYDVLLEIVREKAFALVEATNKDFDISNNLHQVKSCQVNEGKQTDVEALSQAIRGKLMQSNNFKGSSAPPDTLVPLEDRKKPNKIKRSQLTNMIKSEVLKQVETNKRKQRRYKALAKLNKRKRY